MASTLSDTDSVQYHYGPFALPRPPPGPPPDRPLPTPPGQPKSATRSGSAWTFSKYQTPDDDDVLTVIALGIQDAGHSGKDDSSVPQPKDEPIIENGATAGLVSSKNEKNSSKKQGQGHEDNSSETEDDKTDISSSDDSVPSGASGENYKLPGPSLSGKLCGFHIPVAIPTKLSFSEKEFRKAEAKIDKEAAERKKMLSDLCDRLLKNDSFKEEAYQVGKCILLERAYAVALHAWQITPADKISAAREASAAKGLLLDKKSSSAAVVASMAKDFYMTTLEKERPPAEEASMIRTGIERQLARLNKICPDTEYLLVQRSSSLEKASFVKETAPAEDITIGKGSSFTNEPSLSKGATKKERSSRAGGTRYRRHTLVLEESSPVKKTSPVQEAAATDNSLPAVGASPSNKTIGKEYPPHDRTSHCSQVLVLEKPSSVKDTSLIEEAARPRSPLFPKQPSPSEKAMKRDGASYSRSADRRSQVSVPEKPSTIKEVATPKAPSSAKDTSPPKKKSGKGRSSRTKGTRHRSRLPIPEKLSCIEEISPSEEAAATNGFPSTKGPSPPKKATKIERSPRAEDIKRHNEAPKPEKPSAIWMASVGRKSTPVMIRKNKPIHDIEDFFELEEYMDESMA